MSGLSSLSIATTTGVRVSASAAISPAACAPRSPVSPADAAPYRRVHDRDRGDPLGRLRQQQAPAVEPEDARGYPHCPERERRLVHRDERRRVQRAVEERLPALRPAEHGGRVERVRVAVTGQVPGVQDPARISTAHSAGRAQTGSDGRPSTSRPAVRVPVRRARRGWFPSTRWSWLLLRGGEFGIGRRRGWISRGRARRDTSAACWPHGTAAARCPAGRPARYGRYQPYCRDLRPTRPESPRCEARAAAPASAARYRRTSRRLRRPGAAP